MRDKMIIINIMGFWLPVIFVCIYSCCGNITPAAFGNIRNVLPAAFGDFDSDELTDLFVIQNRNTVQIFLGSTVEPYFRQEPELKCTFKDYFVTSIVPGDFDGDALMDVLVTTSTNSDVNNTHVFVLWGGLNHLNCTENPLFIMKDEPLAIDHNRNMTVDLFGVNEHGTRGFWVFKSNRMNEWIPMTERQDEPLRIPHSHAFLDLNDDNSPDLYLTGLTGFEIYLWDNDLSRFNYSHIIPFPPGVSSADQIGQTLFLDVEIADKMDPIVPVCYDRKNTYCKNSTIYVYSKNRWHNLNINFQDNLNKLWSFAIDSGLYTNCITLRGGDFNMDGYPDMLVTLNYADEFRSFLLINFECEVRCDHFARTFKVDWGAFSDSNRNTVMGVFYDFLQDGILDIIFVHKETTINSQYNISAFKNSLDYDANFIKVMVITGLTNNERELPPTLLGAKRHTFGTNLPGPKIRYKTTTQDGNPREGISAQLPQSSHFALYLPYTIFCLGRTPNFVEDLTVGMFNESRTWAQIIPNSQLVVIPYPTDKTYLWRAQLFVTPSKIILQSVIALLGTCFIILIIIGLLHWKERREDRIEKLQEAHRFHFDAM